MAVERALRHVLYDMPRFPLTDYEVREVVRRRDRAGVPDNKIQKWLGMSGSVWTALVAQVEGEP